MKKKRHQTEQGFALVFNVVTLLVFSLIIVSLLGYAVSLLRVTGQAVNREQAFQIAEAGVNYYQWRLAHYNTDYYDGNASTTPGPYVHDYIDKDTNRKVGEYSLTIIPPQVGSTVVTIRSTGYTTASPRTKRTVTVRYGIPSLAKYAFLTNSDVWVGNTENISGEMHSNGGIRFDGSGNAPIASARSTYTCQSYHGCSPSLTKPGIWGGAATTTSAFWTFPQPTVDFSAITANLANLKSSAQTGGLYLAPSSQQGYSLVFQNNGTFRVYKVTSLRSHSTGYDVNGLAHSEDLDYNGRSEQTSVCNPYPCQIPSNGVVYVEDRTWVEGTVRGRALVAAAKLPYNSNTAPSIIIPNNILYSVKDGSDVLGLISQKDILISYFAPNTLEVDAALIAQNGSAQMYYFAGVTKTSLTLYGTVGSNGVWTWSWVNGYGSCVGGYCNTSTQYDANLLFGPPPSFPLSSEGYRQLSWTSD